jgi:hypothetical protein
MSRPHICFIQSQCMPWAEPDGSLRWLAAPGVQLKILSSDSDDESVTAVVRVPPGFQRPWAPRPGRYLEVLMLDGDWTLEQSGHPSVLLGSHGYLRRAASGEQSFLYCAMPQHPPPSIMPGKFTRPVVEEPYTLSGSYVFGDVGRMSAGGYAFWREGQWHGPAGSETGYCLFIRVFGGPLSNQFSAQPAPFSWHPEYRPSLPPHLQAIARAVDEGESW